MTADTDARPDGREPSAETLVLRSATRALRLHLDQLPVDYNLGAGADRFLASLAFMGARQRYDCAESLIGSGFGGMVMGSLARSLLVDALRWRWIAEDPEVRRRSLLGDLILERSRLVVTVEEADLICLNLARWLMPIPNVADLTGHSFNWLDAPPVPSDDDLLRKLLEHPQDAPSGSDADAHSLASSLLDIAGIRAVAEVLAYAGHGNYLGQQSTLAEDGALGWDLRADYEALLLHAAAVGATVTLLGSAEAVPEAWPADVEREPFIQTSVALAKAVSKAAVAVHGLVAPKANQPTLGREKRRPRAALMIRPQAVLSPSDLLGEPSTSALEETFSRAESFYALATSMPVNPWGHGPPTLHEALAYGGVFRTSRP